jgi:hypothetical protein
MRGSRTTRTRPAISQPSRIARDTAETIEGAAKTRLHKVGGKKRSPAKSRAAAATAGAKRNPSAAKRSKPKKTTRARMS